MWAIFKTRIGQLPCIESQFDVFNTKKDALEYLRIKMRKYYQSKDYYTIERNRVYDNNNSEVQKARNNKLANIYWHAEVYANLKTDTQFRDDVFTWYIDKITTEEANHYKFKKVF